MNPPSFLDFPVNSTSNPIHAVESSLEKETVTDATLHDLLPRYSCLMTWAVVFCFLCGSGCATMPYRYGNFRSVKNEKPSEIEFEYGRPQKTLDNIAWATGIWSRILFLNSGMNKHELSEKTRLKLAAYLEENELDDVLVRVNQYDPKGEWRRLHENGRVAPGWRYTIGVVTLVKYSLVPGRVFGGDEYNPFTNTLYINSDVPAVVLHEAAYAKDVHGRPLPGTYAFLNEIPLISLWRRTTCVNDVLGYARTNEDWPMEHETYRVVYPQMGVHSTAMAGAFVPFWDGLVLNVVGAAAGHATGLVAIRQRSGKQNSRVDEFDADAEFDYEELHANRHVMESSEGEIQFTKHEFEYSDDK